MDALVRATDGRSVQATVVGPLGEPVHARFGILGDDRTAVIELAEASGLALVEPGRRNPARATSYGTGQLILAAGERGCHRFIVGLGGSATVDGGAGLAQALGATFLDESGAPLPAPMTAEDLHRVARVEPPPRIGSIRVACDVRNPLLGPDGAAEVYGPQKGATPEQIGRLEAGLARLAWCLRFDTSLPGTGAAGGAAYGLAALLGASLEPGIDLVLEAIRFERRCHGAALVLTGEGRLDRQSLHGKACAGVARIARRHDVPTVAIVGSTGPGAAECLRSAPGGFLDEFVCLSDRFDPESARSQTAALIQAAAAEVVTRMVRPGPAAD